MFVPVVQIGHVWMRVGRWFVSVGMGMAHPGRQPWMRVVVMPIVVAMAVRVEQCLVRVIMLVPCGQHEVEAYRHECRGPDLRGMNRFVEYRPCQGHPHERRGGEDELRAGRSELLRA